MDISISRVAAPDGPKDYEQVIRPEPELLALLLKELAALKAQGN